MKIKNRLLMIGLLSMMTVLILLGSVSAKRREDKNNREDEPTPPAIEVMPDSFLNDLQDPYNVPEEVKKLIIDYMDAYYKSIYTLEQVDTSNLFNNEMMAEISAKALDIVIGYRKMFDFDFT